MKKQNFFKKKWIEIKEQLREDFRPRDWIWLTGALVLIIVMSTSYYRIDDIYAEKNEQLPQMESGYILYRTQDNNFSLEHISSEDGQRLLKLLNQPSSTSLSPFSSIPEIKKNLSSPDCVFSIGFILDEDNKYIYNYYTQDGGIFVNQRNGNILHSSELYELIQTEYLS